MGNVVPQNRQLSQTDDRWFWGATVRQADYTSVWSELGRYRVNWLALYLYQVHAQDTDSLLLEGVGRIPHLDMENHLVRLAARFQLEPQTDRPTQP